MLFLKLFCLCTVLGVVPSSKFEPCGAPECMCSLKSHTATCKGYISYIPMFPSAVIQVQFHGSNFSVIDKELLKNLTTSNVNTILFANTSTREITYDAFQGIHIKNLALNSNRLLKPQLVNLQSLSGKLRSLRMDDNDLETLPNFVPVAVRNEKMKFSFSGNKLSMFDFKYFNGIHILKLHLSNNILTKIKMNQNVIRQLNIDGNRFNTMPDFCNSDNRSYLPRLTTLRFDNNNFHDSIASFSFQCLNNLQKLSLDKNRILTIRKNAFSNLKSLQYLSLKNIGSEVALEEHAFNISHLKKLIFSMNNFHFDHYTQHKLQNLFSNLQSLEQLDLSHNYLPFDIDRFKVIFQRTTALKHLSLESTLMSFELSDKMFLFLTNMEELILASNKIKHWNNGTAIFGHMKNLSKLYLDANNINIVNKSSIPFEILHKLNTLSIGSNPFICSCEQRWFAEWLRTTSVALNRYPYKCQSPTKFQNTYVHDYNPGFFDCLELQFQIAFVVGIVAVGVSCITIVLYMCRWDIRYLWFKMTTKYIPLEEEDDHEYIAYVSYADDDRAFVHDEICNRIPNICIRLRDFELAEYIMQNVETHVEASKKVILVLSNNYFNSHWQAAELNYIHSVSVKRRKYICVVILLDDFDKKFLSPISRGFLHDSPCLEWTTNRKGQKLFWRRLEYELTKPAKRYLHI